MNDLTTFQEEQIQNRIKKRLENELLLTCLPHAQSTLTRNCVTKQANLGKLDGDIFNLLGNLPLDIEVIMEVALEELERFFYHTVQSFKIKGIK